jgi:hypothetical protein
MNLKDTLLIGDQQIISFKANVPKGAKLIIPKPDSTLKGLEVVGNPQIDTISQNGNNLELLAKLKITSFDSGSHYFPKMPAIIIKPGGGTDTIWYGDKSYEYSTIQIDTTTYKPYDVKGQRTYPVTLAEILLWSGGMLLFALLIWVLIRYIKRRRANRRFFEIASPDEPPYLVALRELEKIRAQKLWQNNKEKQFYTHITDILRVYIESRFKMPAMEYTSAEILKELTTKGIEVSVYTQLKELLNIADLVKFAKYKATSEENEGAVPAAIKFINGTYAEVTENEKGE